MSLLNMHLLMVRRVIIIAKQPIENFQTHSLSFDKAGHLGRDCHISKNFLLKSAINENCILHSISNS